MKSLKVRARAAKPAGPAAVPVVLLTFLAFALRLYRLGSVELWFDEAASYVVAIRSLPDIVSYVRTAAAEHPPAYFILLHYWMDVAGRSEFALRFLSLLLGVLFVPVMYRLARREFGASIGLGAALIAAASPYMVVYSQEARMYTLVPLLSLLMIEACLAVVRRDRAREWLAFLGLLTVGISVHYYFALWVPAFFLFLVSCGRAAGRRVLVRWLLIVALLGGAFAAWLSISPGVYANVLFLFGGVRLVPWQESLQRIVQDAVWGDPFGVIPSAGLRLFAMLAWLPVFAALRLVLRAHSAPAAQALMLCLSLVLAAMSWVLVTPRGIVGRHVSAMEPAFLLLLSAGMFELLRRPGIRRALAAGALILIFVIGIGAQLRVDKGDWGAALARVDRDALPGDAIVLAQPTAWPITTYYHRRGDVPVIFLPDQSSGGTVLPEDFAPNIAEFVEMAARPYKRIWLGPTGPGTSDPGRIMPRWLAAQRYALQASYYHAVSFNVFASLPGELTERAADVAFGRHIRLVSALLGSDLAPAGSTVPLALQWRTDDVIAADHMLIFKLVDGQGVVWMEKRILPCGGYCQTSDWRVDEDVTDREAIEVPAGTPPGPYALTLEVYNLGARSTVNAAGGRAALTLALMTVQSGGMAKPPLSDPLAARFGSALQLAGIDKASSEAREGGAWSLDLYWRALAAPDTDMIAAFDWLDASGARLDGREYAIGPLTYPTSAWQAGDLVRQHVDMPLPRGASGPLQLALRVYRFDNGQALKLTQGDAPLPDAYPLDVVPTGQSARQLPLAVLNVRPIERSFLLPDPVYPVSGADFGGRFQLMGYNLARRPHGALDVALIWRSLSPAAVDYKVFVHVVSEAGVVAAQHDGEPAYDFRPVSGWLPGEYVKDEHRIDLSGLPPGRYRLVAGMYDPAGGARVPVTLQGAPQPFDQIELTVIPAP